MFPNLLIEHDTGQVYRETGVPALLRACVRERLHLVTSCGRHLVAFHVWTRCRPHLAVSNLQP
jgi:hypothetical protein